MSQDAHIPLILVVDDDPQSLRLLNHALSSAGYDVAIANSGAVCFKVLEKRRPDLILCDVIMPEIDGYEVCRRIKANEVWRDIPLMFLTARTEPEDLIAGFEAGAVDYVTKPFSQDELLARVRTHTELKHARDTIIAYTRQLETLNERLKTLDAEKNHFLGIVAHDLKNPLTTIIMSAEMVEDRVERMAPPDVAEYMRMIQRNGERIRSIITRLLDVNRIESGKLAVDSKPFDLAKFAAQLVEQHRPKAERKQIELVLSLPAQPVQLISDQEIVHQIADNLLSNAIKYSPPGFRVEITVGSENERAWLSIADQGPGFTEADRVLMFQKFARLSARPTAGEASTGLGLSIAKRLSELLQGELSCISEPGKGAAFTLSLPRRYGDEDV